MFLQGYAIVNNRLLAKALTLREANLVRPDSSGFYAFWFCYDFTVSHFQPDSHSLEARSQKIR